MYRDNRRNQVETQPVPRRRTAGFKTRESFDDSLAILGRYARPVVADRESCIVTVLCQLHVDRRVRRSMDLRIVHQVDKRLGNEFSVAFNGDVRLNDPAEAPDAIVDGWDVQFAKFCDERGQIDTGEGSSNTAALDFRYSKNGRKQGKYLIGPFNRRE